MAKLKKLKGFELNQIVYIISENKYDKIVRIDGHVYPICVSLGGRYLPTQLLKDETPSLRDYNNEMFTMDELLGDGDEYR